MSRLIEFYAGRGGDHRGRTLAEIQGWDDRALEFTHDYIQWLFPTARRSAFNPYAPELPAADIAEFHAREDLRANLRASFLRMLAFYGLALDRDGAKLKIARGPNWEDRGPKWLRLGDHNHLRITRILDSLCTLGLKDEARAFLAALLELAESDEGRAALEPVTLDFWRRAEK